MRVKSYMPAVTVSVVDDLKWSELAILNRMADKMCL